MRFRFAFLSFALLVGCYKLNIENGQLRCSVPEKKCPGGFHCAVDGYCWKTGQNPTTSADMAGAPVSSDMAPTDNDMAQPPPAPNKGGVVVSGGVTATSTHYQIIMTTGQTPGGNVDATSSSYQLKSGLPALSQ